MDSSQANSKERKRLLFICNQNRLRSPTAEVIFSEDPRFEVRSAGVDPDATLTVTRELLEWADLIFVMEKRQRNKIRSRYEDIYQAKKIICLYIPDNYDYLDPELVGLIRDRTSRYL